MNGSGWDRLRARFPWPAIRPTTVSLVHGWTTEEAAWDVLLARIPDDGIVFEVGAWTGKTSIHVLSKCPAMRLIALDVWCETPVVLGNYWLKWRTEGLMHDSDSPKSLYQANLWDYRDRVVVLQADSVAGMLAVAHCGLAPDLVYIDADHAEASAYRDVRVALELFPESLICGHDYINNDGTEDCPVGRAVRRCAAEAGLQISHMGKVWWYG